MEEFCRFGLNSAALSRRCRQLRHELSAAVQSLEAGRLISSRDTLGDVGLGSPLDGRLRRQTLADCFTAAAKRLPEALRALAEMAQTIDPAVAENIEKIRYTAYTLEKDIALFAEPAEKFKRVALYVIITSRLPAEVISLAQSCGAAGADCIQLRAKELPDATLLALASEFVGICKDHGVLSIINDRVDIAGAAGADGVHLGQDDLPVATARALQLAPLIIGKSTHSIKQLKSACEENPTYVALGPVFATTTKPCAEAVGTEYVRQAVELLADTGIAHVAIGGINADNVEQVLEAGARAVAVCSAVTESEDPVGACRALKEKIQP